MSLWTRVSSLSHNLSVPLTGNTLSNHCTANTRTRHMVRHGHTPRPHAHVRPQAARLLCTPHTQMHTFHSFAAAQDHVTPPCASPAYTGGSVAQPATSNSSTTRRCSSHRDCPQRWAVGPLLPANVKLRHTTRARGCPEFCRTWCTCPAARDNEQPTAQAASVPMGAFARSSSTRVRWAWAQCMRDMRGQRGRRGEEPNCTFQLCRPPFSQNSLGFC